MKGRLSYLSVTLIAACLASCGRSAPAHNIHDAATGTSGDGGSNVLLVDTAVSLLQTGDVVLRMGTGAQSLLLSRLNKTDKSYSHCGMVVKENGYPFVYHCIGGEDNPNARLRRDSAHRFFSPLHNTALAIARYQLDSLTQKSLIISYYRRHPRFDLAFDLATDDALYCTEFAWKILTETAGDTSFVPLSEINGRRYVGTDNLYLNNHARLVWQVQFM